MPTDPKLTPKTPEAQEPPAAEPDNESGEISLEDADKIAGAVTTTYTAS